MKLPVQLIECPRDAMQGWSHPIATSDKVAYINQLLKVGFHTIDFGSFVSPKAIPQMADTADVIRQLEYDSNRHNLLAIVANLRGAEAAMSFPNIDYLGFPFSVSPTFQRRNTNSTIEESLDTVKAIQQLCTAHNKQLVVYLSMGFGNPYGDAWSPQVVFDWANQLASLGIGTLSLADTVGVASPDQVHDLTAYLVQQMPGTTIGVHLHATAQNWREKMKAAYTAGCRRYDGALKGFGGCPMAGNDLVGNMDTLWLIEYLEESGEDLGLDKEALDKAVSMAGQIFV
ncbi:hydroxymethylglutaryl-CoA lyase [Flavihumibacter rivuli]|uniref:hydroxymethylglutaryl-CoA lyase n=1 Tax=Flavihumibacter rivuli TaxID=2838156 RepID=UPI001BDF38B3|nr:hydroxymethylglutaryl-CoA lyase [Flavihumibacter rivuli]ULQ57802.1 hydroxymethylglutaryl-CoA lyase [Flavihumibacter rivuli]